MSEETTTVPRLQFSQFVGDGGQVVVRSDSIDDLMSGVAELAENSSKLQDAVTAIGNAMGISGAGSNKPDAPVTTTQRRNTGRSVKPGERAAASGDIPNCACGIPMNDVRGKTYRGGPKAGQPYPASFYASRDCKAGCPSQ